LNLFQEYEKQQLWRDWPQYLNFIPLTSSDAVVDLGCSVGDVSRTFSEQVERVVGIDLNKEFVQFCQASKTNNETFIHSDFLNVDYSSLGLVNGIWASYSLSYLTRPEEYLKQLHSIIAPDGWIALLDVACFISGNLSKDSLYYERVRQFELASYQSGLYDFNFGDKMQSMLLAAGFEIIHVDNNVTDPELNFSGAASLDVIQGWSARLSRMQKLSELLGDKYSDFCVDLLSNLGSNSHEKRGSVRFVVAKKAD
jgi:SAM-dependent methyltransferase